VLEHQPQHFRQRTQLDEARANTEVQATQQAQRDQVRTPDDSDDSANDRLNVHDSTP
jgi:hypothetical protein